LIDSHLRTYKDDNKEITRQQLVERLKKGENFKTSMTPIGQLIKIVEKMFKKYDSVIFLPISKGLSSQ
jgi:fatty acid-binding protein DegV